MWLICSPDYSLCFLLFKWRDQIFTFGKHTTIINAWLKKGIKCSTGGLHISEHFSSYLRWLGTKPHALRCCFIIYNTLPVFFLGSSVNHIPITDLLHSSLQWFLSLVTLTSYFKQINLPQGPYICQPPQLLIMSWVPNWNIGVALIEEPQHSERSSVSLALLIEKAAICW